MAALHCSEPTWNSRHRLRAAKNGPLLSGKPHWNVLRGNTLPHSQPCDLGGMGASPPFRDGCSLVLLEKTLKPPLDNAGQGWEREISEGPMTA